MRRNNDKWIVVALLVVLVLIPVYALSAAYEETDIVVVGGGSSGLAAAVSASQKGAKVVLIEKEPFLGGSSTFAEGIFAVGTEEQRQAGVLMTTDEAFKHAFEYSHALADAPVLRTAIEESGPTVAWLKRDMGVTFEVMKWSPIEPTVFHMASYKGKRLGAAMVAAYVDKAKELGVTMLTKTTGKRIIVEKDRVVGLEALDAQGKPFVIKAKAVVIATGGFNNSDELIAKWTRFDPKRIETAVRLHKVGEGIQMAMAQGADTKGFGLMLGQGNPPGPGLKHPDWVMGVSGSPVLWVNAAGERFADESLAMDFPMACNAIYGQPGSFAWGIWDEETARHWKEEGIDLGPSVPMRIGTKVDVMPEIASGVAAGNKHVAIADSIPELARKIGVDPARLQQTIERYNAFAASNRDADFSKDRHWLRPVKKGKLMAARLVAWSQVSIGGVRVTPRMEVIRQTGAPIPGIYAAGADVGGLWGDTYTVWTSGIMLSWCSTSGRLAGSNAAAFVKSGNK